MPPRSVRWEKQFSDEMARLEPDPERADELVEGIDWVLARLPTYGTNIAGTNVWVISIREVAKHRTLVVFYTYSNIEIFLLSVIPTELIRQ